MEDITEFKFRRMAAGVPAIQVAARAGMDRTRLTFFENGHVEPTDADLSRLSEALGAIIEDRRRLAQLAAEAGISLHGVQL
jgi:transcriptional regulator with XRE-family HTH domain